MPTALYSIYANVGLHVTVPRMPVLELYESLILRHGRRNASRTRTRQWKGGLMQQSGNTYNHAMLFQ